MEKINIAEILKDCPSGMELDCAIYEDVYFDDIDEVCDIIKCYIQEPKHKIGISFNKYGHYSNTNKSKCVIFPKGKTTWEGFQRPFKDGDVLVHTQNERFVMSIYKSNESGIIINTHAIFWDREEGLSVGMQICCYTDSTRFATEEEKQKLFDAIKSNGYEWKEETKTLEKLVEPCFKVGDRIKDIRNNSKGIILKINNDSYECRFEFGNFLVDFKEQDNFELIPKKFNIDTLVPFESRVLVRHNKDNKWCGSFFSFIDRDHHSYCYKFVTTAGKSYPMMIPYKGNEWLLGKTDDCDEYYKTW